MSIFFLRFNLFTILSVQHNKNDRIFFILFYIIYSVIKYYNIQLELILNYCDFFFIIMFYNSIVEILKIIYQ
jgi:hypothetical protein